MEIGIDSTSSSPREIRSHYFEVSNSTETWIRLKPQDETGKVAPINLIFTATFPGKKQDRVPSEIEIRAQVDPLFIAPRFTLKLTPHPGKPLDLVGPIGTMKNSIGTNFQYLPNCPGGGCAITAVASYLPWDLFMQIAQSESLTGDVLGVDVAFQQSDLDALRAFAKALVPAREALPQIQGK
jgi:hypothetical protein